MRAIILFLLVLSFGTACKNRSLVCARNTPDWYEPDNCGLGSTDPSFELAYITRRGAPLKGRRIYLQEVDPSDTCSRLSTNGNDLLMYSNVLIDARL